MTFLVDRLDCPHFQWNSVWNFQLVYAVPEIRTANDWDSKKAEEYQYS